MSRTTRLYSIDSLHLALTKSNPPELLVTATGQAATTGWNDISLVPLESELSPDGILDLAFVGTPPQEVFAAFLVPAIAHYVWKDAEKIVGVKVHARTNDLTRLLVERASGAHGGLTTLAIGEEGPPITEIAGEAHGGQHGSAATAHFAGAKTLANGEEHLTTLAVGEEHLPGPTTLIYGEEGHGATTLIYGEEGTHFFGETPTFFPGEHGPSNPIAEQPSNLFGEHSSSPIGEQFRPQPDPWSPVEFGGINAFGRR